jgi:hypothetical protein
LVGHLAGDLAPTRGCSTPAQDVAGVGGRLYVGIGEEDQVTPTPEKRAQGPASRVFVVSPR